ncbi:hypothetical protein GMB86_05535 [Terrilactibacillus sp. BCM23-1]|uniref:Uncharacterized protein n=1 Tax=Terrilactibacillus tamarindi TaxID=2599694 RepID=A0A6N8CNE5_9BACI|nr:hypothetical protein [Terrilactibacillus tamarindi]MTT31481.1 hypothetical protein [Terrilactibacillus tamarindi]
MYTVETILNRVNGTGYGINPAYTQAMLKYSVTEKEKIKLDLFKYANIDFTNNRHVIGFINNSLLRREAIQGKTISNKILEELFEETNNPFFQTLIAFRKCHDRYKKVASLIKAVIDSEFNKDNDDNVTAFLNREQFEAVWISPEAKLNSIGGISLSNPSLPFSTEDIKNIFVSDYIAIPCKDMDGVLYILNKYGDLLNEENYIVIGTTLYSDIRYSEWNGIPFPPSDEEEIKHMEDLRREIGIDYYGDKIEEEHK